MTANEIWIHIGVTFSYDGTDTESKIYADASLDATNTYSNQYIRDKDTYTHAWLGTSTTLPACTGSGDVAPFETMVGYIYSFRIWQEVRTAADMTNEIVTGASSCIGNCAKCPNQVSMKSYSLNFCLWTCERNELEFTDGSATPCDRNDADAANDCTADQGC